MRSDPLSPSADSRAAPRPVDAEKMLQAATALFANFGFEGVGTREIARSCGCSVPSIYYHFDSKENLYREIFDEKREDLLLRITAQIDQASTPVGRLRAFVVGFYRCFRDDRELLLLILRDIINAASARPRYLFGRDHEHFVVQLRSILRELQPGEVEDRDVLAVMSQIFGFCCAGLLQDPMHGSRISGEDALMEMVLRLIAKPVT